MSKRTKKPLNQSFMKRMRRVFPEVSTHDLRIRIKRLISEGKIIDMCENADDAEQNSTNKQQISPSEQQKHQRQFLDSQNQIDGNQTQNNQNQNESQTDNNATIFNNNNATVFNNNNNNTVFNNNATVFSNNATVFNNNNATVFNNDNNATVLNNANTTVFNNDNATVFNNNNNDTVLNNANTIVFNNDSATVFNDNVTAFNDNATVFNDNVTAFNDNATVFNNEETQYQVNNNKQIEINQSQINKLHELLTQQAIKSVGGHEELIKQIYDYLLRSNHGTSSEILHQMILQLARQNPASDPAPPNPTPLAIDEAQNLISKLDEFNPLDPILNDDTNLDIDDNPQEDL